MFVCVCFFFLAIYSAVMMSEKHLSYFSANIIPKITLSQHWFRTLINTGTPEGHYHICIRSLMFIKPPWSNHPEEYLHCRCVSPPYWILLRHVYVCGFVCIIYLLSVWGKEAESVTEEDSAMQRNLPLWKPPTVLPGFLGSLETRRCVSPLADLTIRRRNRVRGF